MRPRDVLWRIGVVGMLASLAGSGLAQGAPGEPASSALAPVDLAKPFDTRSPWRLIATQGPPVDDYGGNPAPGALHLCLAKEPATACAPDPRVMPPLRETNIGPAWEPHYLNLAKPVYPQGRSAPPLLLIQTASLHSGDGGQVVVTQLLRYDRANDVFTRIYVHDTGTNNNQEVRFMAEGPLQGAVISAEPTSNAPYAYWIAVNRFTPQRTYKQVLRYRSATRYGDNNPMPVIDSEMPNIQGRLGLWKPGWPLPLPPDRPCPRPRLKRGALWCE
jgi:hypothetical protein